uniref:Glutathione transferase n=1 Tax=Anolis carolinensis TaxID=28377 RepID=A0A803TZT3_ANOCA
MVLELYLDLVSQPCRAVYIFAKKNKIPFEFKSTELMKGDSPGGSRPPSNTYSVLCFLLAQALVPLFLGRPLPEEKLAAAMEVLERRWRSLREVSWEGGGPSSPAARPSLADLVALVELMHPVAAGHDLFASRPKMAAWRSRVEGAVGRELFQEAHKPLFDSKDASLDHLPPALREQLTGLLLKYIG